MNKDNYKHFDLMYIFIVFFNLSEAILLSKTVVPMLTIEGTLWSRVIHKQTLCLVTDYCTFTPSVFAWINHGIHA